MLAGLLEHAAAEGDAGHVDGEGALVALGELVVVVAAGHGPYLPVTRASIAARENGKGRLRRPFPPLPTQSYAYVRYFGSYMFSLMNAAVSAGFATPASPRLKTTSATLVAMAAETLRMSLSGG